MTDFDAISSKESINPPFMADKRTDIGNLDLEERELLESYERGEWVSDLTPERVKELQSYVQATWEERKRDSKREDEL